jgi:hypothetical protein
MLSLASVTEEWFLPPIVNVMRSSQESMFAIAAHLFSYQVLSILRSNSRSLY